MCQARDTELYMHELHLLLFSRQVMFDSATP